MANTKERKPATEKDLSYMTQSVESLDFDSVADVMADLLTDT